MTEEQSSQGRGKKDVIYCRAVASVKPWYLEISHQALSSLSLFFFILENERAPIKLNIQEIELNIQWVSISKQNARGLQAALSSGEKLLPL